MLVRSAPAHELRALLDLGLAVAMTESRPSAPTNITSASRLSRHVA
jgi:hypothetical protein